MLGFAAIYSGLANSPLEGRTKKSKKCGSH